jgi:ribosomal protein L37AE/L43A
VYWGQVAVALASALGTASYLYTRGRSALVAVLAAIVVYFLIRWVIAWGYRVRYWYRRGTKGYYSTSCPDCGQYIYRRRRDWILTCGRCGWTAGWPVVRWLTQSVPARQLRRTVVGPQLVVVIVVSALLLSGTAATLSLGQVALPEGESPSESGSQGQSPAASGTPTETATPTDNPNLNAVGFNETRVERLVFRLVNERRQTRNMPNYTYDGDVADAAREHAEEMAKNDYFSHTSLVG